MRAWLIGFSSAHVAGRGGASIYGKQFEDELHPDLKFTGKSSGWTGWEEVWILKGHSSACDSR